MPNTASTNLLHRATLRVLVAFPLCPESSLYARHHFAVYNFVRLATEATVVRQSDAGTFFAFTNNRCRFAANLAMDGFENAFSHCHIGLDAKDAPFDASSSRPRVEAFAHVSHGPEISRWGFP